MQHSFYKRQKGFTLLELLVVITLLAVLAVGALVAYEGVGDQAGATAAANNTATVDSALRNYKAVTKTYPNQWDNLSASDTGVALASLATPTKSVFGDWAIGAATAADRTAVVNAFNSVASNTLMQLQQLTAAAATSAVGSNIAPNLQHNEGANPNATQDNVSAVTHVSIVPTVAVGGTPAAPTSTACTAGTQSISTLYSGAAADFNAARRLNKINDSLQSDECQLVVALGFGHDAAHSTTDASVAIAQAPTHSSKAINPAKNYARYIALFHMGTDGDANNNITGAEIKATPHLIAVVDPEGNPIDVNLMAANANN